MEFKEVKYWRQNDLSVDFKASGESNIFVGPQDIWTSHSAVGRIATIHGIKRSDVPLLEQGDLSVLADYCESDPIATGEYKLKPGYSATIETSEHSWSNVLEFTEYQPHTTVLVDALGE